MQKKMEIGRNVALAEIDQSIDEYGKPVFFSLAFYTSSGEYRELQKCSKKWKKTGSKTINVEKTKQIYSIKEKGLLHFYEHSSERHISIHIQLIVKYNGYYIKH